MEFRKELQGIFFCAALLGVAGSAQAMTINMSLVQAAWGNVVIESPNTLTGVGTSEIMWNMPLNDGEHSAFRFANTAELFTPTDNAFSLGTFTYLNYPLQGEDLHSADLYINAVLNIDGTTVTVNSLGIPFVLHQISGKCGNPNCTRDQVKLKAAEDIGTFTVGGMAYTLSILGFMTDGNLKNVLHTFDSDQSSAELIGVLSATAMPEPGTFFLLLGGFTALYWNRRRLTCLVKTSG